MVGLNKIVNHWFQDELAILETKGLSISNVRPITLVDIDTLLVFQDALRFKTVSLDKLIDDYQLYVNTKRRRQVHSEAQAHQAIVDSLIPFSLFVEKRLRLNAPPKMLLEKGMSIFLEESE